MGVQLSALVSLRHTTPSEHPRGLEVPSGSPGAQVQLKRSIAELQSEITRDTNRIKVAGWRGGDVITVIISRGAGLASRKLLLHVIWASTPCSLLDMTDTDLPPAGREGPTEAAPG